jgi:TrmH family RNA methyltransferase
MHNLENISKNKLKEIQKLHQKKYRDENNVFLAEGEKILEEIISQNIEIVEVFALKSFDKKGISITVVDENTMKKISTTSSACEVLTIAKKKHTDLSLIQNKNKIILLDEISDPGNLGTIIRSATAFNFDAIILYGNCVDLYSPKVLRSTAGNFFKIPIIEISTINQIKSNFKNHTIIATALSENNNISLENCSKIDNYIVMFGSEAKGLNKELISLADKNIRLEMKNNVDSLNLSVCASIIMYELFSLNNKCQ